MTLLHTPEKKDNFAAPDFKLKGVDGTQYTYRDCAKENGCVVMFICNHCPYVLTVANRLASTCARLQEQGIGSVAIMANDTLNYPEDSYDNMKLFAQKYGFTFPYVIDETQETAKTYGAVCTPDIYGFDKDGILQYRGRLDSAANNPADETTVPELYNAMMEIKETGIVNAQQSPSMGCSIKWK
ncbi:MAG: thioredoxin family protein [Alphaproteobacteria bacterium]|nr:thioredoxin family protein [Alphaproteobacteria bacterium]